jgi:hypothetical protein
MGADDLLCSRNARSRTPLVGRAQWKINQPPSLKRKQASLERWNRIGQVPFLLTESGRGMTPMSIPCSRIAHDKNVLT